MTVPKPGHRESAELLIRLGTDTMELQISARDASLATAHAVLALLDYLQQDDTMPNFEETINNDIEKELQTQQEYIRHLGRRIVHLEEDLEGARTALRARDDALNTEMKAAADDRP